MTAMSPDLGVSRPRNPLMTTMTPADRARAAVFALPPGGRRPAAPGWHQRCITDPALARRLWAPGDNIGVGYRASGVVGINLDRHPDGVDGTATFQALCASHGQAWPDTLTVSTPHAGLHLILPRASRADDREHLWWLLRTRTRH